MNWNLESARRGELALTDWVRIIGLLIFAAFVCFSIVLFGKGANHPPVNPTQALVHSSAPIAGLEPRPEWTAETRARPATAVTPAETQPQSSEVSSELAQGTTHELATTDPESAKAMLGNRSNSPVRRFSSRRRVASYKRSPRSFKMLMERWFRTFRTKSHR
jgi:hypothetical protein